MPARAPVLLALLVLTVGGCSFERRPPREPPEDSARSAEDGGDASDGRMDASSAAARAVLDSLQSARRSGDRPGTRRHLAPGALLLHEGRPLSLADGGPAIESLLTLPTGGAGGPRAVVDGRPVDGGLLWVLGYGDPDSSDSPVVETIILVPDSAGWRVRFLQRFESG